MVNDKFDIELQSLKKLFKKASRLFLILTYTDFTRHFFSSLSETVDSSFVVVLNR